MLQTLSKVNIICKEPNNTYSKMIVHPGSVHKLSEKQSANFFNRSYKRGVDINCIDVKYDLLTVPSPKSTKCITENSTV